MWKVYQGPPFGQPWLPTFVLFASDGCQKCYSSFVLSLKSANAPSIKMTLNAHLTTLKLSLLKNLSLRMLYYLLGNLAYFSRSFFFFF